MIHDIYLFIGWTTHLGETSKPTNKCYEFCDQRGAHSNSHKLSERDS